MIDFGLTREEFRLGLFEQQARLFRGALKERPIAWSDIDALLHAIEPGAPVMRLFHNGPVPEQEYTAGTATPGRAKRKLHKVNFYRYMAHGATLVINRLQDYSVAAQRLCVEVARFAGTQTSANAYLSFNGRGTFGKHWDTHDVFAIQLIGRKRWQVFAPTLPLPLSYQTNDSSGHTPPDQPLLDVTLEEGDVMYLPRGWWHQAIPLDAGSFHLSIGSYTSTIYDYVLRTTSRYLRRQAAARRSFVSAGAEEALAEAIRELPAALLDSGSAAEFELDMVSREQLVSEFHLAEILAATTSAAPLSDGAEIRLTTGYAPKLENGEILVNGSRLRLDPIRQRIVVELRDTASLRFDALCERLADVPRDVMQQMVLDLSCYEILTIET